MLATLNVVQEGVQVISRDWRYLYVNDSVCRHGRLTRDQLLGRTMSECYPGIDETPLFRTLERCMREGTSQEMENEFTYPDGARAWFDLRIEPCPEGIFVLSVDITRRKDLENQLRQIEKMNAIGRLAGGVAHDFNNLLTAIQGLATFALDAVPAEQQAAQDLREVLVTVGRAATLTHQLLAFARAQPVAPRVIDVNANVASLDKMLRRLLGEDIEIVTRAGAELWFTLLDPGAFEQVLINLAINARDAMAAGGRLTIETQNVRLDEGAVLRRGGVLPAGEYVLLAVSDDGPGMDVAVQERIFEPFFTTKPPGKGTGLGLSTCYGIVRQAGGYIWVYSEPGQGTTFKIYLPRSGPPAPLGDQPVAAADRRGGTESVLLVEDDEQVRGIAVRALSAAGYDVVVAGHAEQAIALTAGRGRPFDLLVTDVILPAMGGADLARELRAREPGLRALYISGYSEAAMAQRGALPAGARMLAKPFTPRQLVDRVRDVLDEA
jgi:PAS domain S-box-containing protein